MRRIARSLALAVAMLPLPALAAEGERQGPAADCVVGICQIRVTPQQLLAQAEALVRAGRYSEAEPMIEALAQAPEMRLQSRFLAGFSASEQGQFGRAADTFKAILSDDPGQTRVRLELARAMLGLGQTASADRQFRIAQQSGELSPDIARAIRGARDVIRSRRAWRLDVDFGIAPDSNINNATGADSVTINFGDTQLPIALDETAQARSGTGQTASLSAGARLPVSGRGALLVGIEGNGTNYAGGAYDDYSLQLAAGPQLNFSDTASISLEGVAAQRWFGGGTASRQVGARLGGQLSLFSNQRIGLQLDARRTIAAFDPSFSGWQAGLYANTERPIAPTLVASAGLFARRDWLNQAAFSSTEVGGTLGLGGELPWGVNFGVSGSVSRAVFDAPLALFSLDPRKDWRFGGRLTLGNRKVRVFGFSPQVNLSYIRNGSNLAFFATDRLRLRFTVARYF